MRRGLSQIPRAGAMVKLQFGHIFKQNKVQLEYTMIKQMNMRD